MWVHLIIGTIASLVLSFLRSTRILKSQERPIMSIRLTDKVGNQLVLWEEAELCLLRPIPIKDSDRPKTKKGIMCIIYIFDYITFSNVKLKITTNCYFVVFLAKADNYYIIIPF